MNVQRRPIFDCVKELRGGQPFAPAEITLLDAAIDEALGISAQPKALREPTVFFKSVRAVFGSLAQDQVDGFNTLLASVGAARWPISWAAYGLATAWHETNATMRPVREAYWLSEQWRKENLRYWPWYGRGFVQLTWKLNYERADEELKLNGALVADPDLALRPDLAAKILHYGMEAGWFTNKRLADYLPLSGKGGFEAYRDARRVINGQDKAEKIAKEALVFEGALSEAGW